MIVVLIILIAVAIFFLFITIRSFSLRGNKKLKEAMKLESQGKYHEALVAYDILLNSGYSPSEIRWKIANTALKANIIPRAQKELTVLIDTKNIPDNVSVLAIKTLLAECNLRMGKSKDAFVDLLELSRMDPENPQILFELGKIYAGQRMTGRAIQLLEKAYKFNSNDHELCYFTAKAYLDHGDPEKATEFFEKCARQKYFDHGRINYYLGVLYFSNKNYNYALEHLGEVLRQRPKDNRMLSETHHLIALCYKEKGLVDEAFTNFEKSQSYSELLPEEGVGKKTLYNQGVLLYKSGHYKEALEKFYKLKVLDYKYKDVDQVIRNIAQKLRSGEEMDKNVTNYITENPLINIMKRGLLYSKNRFNIEIVETEAEKYIAPEQPRARVYTYSVNKINDMSSKDFKDLARKLVKASGYYIKSEPKFSGDNEYLDGDAINFISVPIKNIKEGKEVLMTVRRYKNEVPEISVSRFIDWVEENGSQGIFMASAPFDSHSLRLVHSNPNIKFIDKSGLSRMLGRLG